MAVVALAALVAGTAVEAYESHEQGVAASNQAKRQARVEADKATQQQIGMRQRMLAALASQNASAGVGGIGTSRNTGFGANVNRQITQSQNDLMVSKANSSAQVSLLDQAASNDVSAGNIGAATDVLSGISKVAGGGANGG